MSHKAILESSQTGPVPVRFATLKDRVAVILGRQQDDASLFRAGEFVNRAIDELNIRAWKSLLTTGTPITTAADTKEYPLDSPFFKESKVQRLNSDGNVVESLSYDDWEAFQTNFQEQSDTSTPVRYTLRNVHQDGKIQLYPVPDKVYTLSVQYYPRVAQLADQNDTLAVPIEFQNYIILKAQFYFLDLFHHARTEAKGAQARAAWFDLMTLEEHHPDQKSRWRIRPSTENIRGTLYIKV